MTIKRTGAQILWEALVREGVQRCVRLSGRRDPAGLRRDARLPDPAHPRAARAGRDAHGRRLRARQRAASGVAIATSGPGATNMVTGIATAMMDSSPIVCITGQVGSKLIGSDAFQETDITGITLPITKHNYLVTRAEDVAPAVREAFAVARSGRSRARCWSTSPRTRSRRRAKWTGTPRGPTCRKRRTTRCRATAITATPWR